MANSGEYVAPEPVDFATFTSAKPKRRKVKMTPARLASARANAAKAREGLAMSRARKAGAVAASPPPGGPLAPPADPTGLLGLAGMVTELTSDPDFGRAMRLFGDVIRRYAEKHGQQG